MIKSLSVALTCISIGLGCTQLAVAQSVPSEPAEAESPATPSTLLPGLYRGRGTTYITSWRRVERRGDRFCVEIAGGPPNPYAGLIVSTISSLSLRENQLYVDSSNFPLTQRPSRLESGKEHVDFGPPFLRTEWILDAPAEGQVSSAPQELPTKLTECLAASEAYVGYQCRWTNGRNVWLSRSTLPPLPLPEDQQQLAEDSCEQGAALANVK